MATKNNRKKIMDGIVRVLTETDLDRMGVAKENINKDMILRQNGMDDIYSIEFMMFLEQEFKQDIDDKFFVRDDAIPDEQMWQFKPLKDLVDYLETTLK